MAVYSSAANNDAGNLAASPTVIHCIIPHASVGMSLVEWYATQDETGAIGGRMSLIAATGGTSSEALTPELLNTRSAAAGFTTQTKFSVEPSTSGNRLIAMAYDADTTRVAHRRWLTPNPRYPIYRDAGDPKLCLNIETSAQVTFTRYLVIAEDKRSSFDVVKGRRGRTRGYFIIQDEARHFGGVSTAPKTSAGANAYISLQMADWDTTPPSYNPAVFLNLLNAAGSAFDPSTVPWMPTLPDRFSVAPWNPERTETARAGWTQTIWAVPPTKIPEPILPERQARPAWDPERTHSVGIPYLPPTWPTTVMSPERNARPQWDPDRTASVGIPYLPPRWPTTVVAPERQARPAWNPERSHSVGIPYLPPTWPTTVVAPERNARPPWDPERSETARAGWIQALWAIAPQKIPEPALPERFVAPWRPQDQQPIWPPFQFAAIAVPVWGYETLGTQNVAIGWNPERGGLFISGFTPTVPVFGYEVHGPERLLLQWNPGRTELTRAGWIQSLWAIPPQNWQPLLPTQPYPLIAPDRSALCIPIVVASVPRTTVYAIFIFDE